MTYYRLRDIHTPPFAYALNKERAVSTCPACQMPLETLRCPLEIEICQIDLPSPVSPGHGMMADHWLIGNESFAAALERVLPGQFEHHPVVTGRWREAGYVFFWAKHKLDLCPAPGSLSAPLPCRGCGRAIPEISFETEPAPDVKGEPPLAASLKDFHFEGYDYLFHRDALASLGDLAAKMILEPLHSGVAVSR